LTYSISIPSFPSTSIVSRFWGVFYYKHIMSHYGALARLPWDDDQEDDDDDEMNLFDAAGGDSKMALPMTSKVVSGPPAFPPELVTPTRGAGKGKGSSATAELTPHGPCTGPSLVGPSATSSHPSKPTMASRTSSQASASPALPVCAPTEPPTEEPIPPLHHEHTRNLLKVLDHSIDILGKWSGKSWSTLCDQMCLAQSISVLVRIVTNNRWHTQPFEDTPNAPMLASKCRRLFPTPGTTHRSADKAGPQTQTPSLPPALMPPQTPRPAPPALSIAHHPLSPPSLTGALLPQDPFQGSSMLTPSVMSQPWSIWPRLCQICLLIIF
jgi:hypothetical protein